MEVLQSVQSGPATPRRSYVDSLLLGTTTALIDPRLLALVERVTVPVVLICVLGAVGFFAATRITPPAEFFWVVYGALWLVGLLFVAWYERRRDTRSVVESTDPVALLKSRYAAGQVDEVTFERMLDTLLDSPHPVTVRRERVAEPER